jgi:hypothetical protein
VEFCSAVQKCEMCRKCVILHLASVVFKLQGSRTQEHVDRVKVG